MDTIEELEIKLLKKFLLGIALGFIPIVIILFLGVCIELGKYYG